MRIEWWCITTDPDNPRSKEAAKRRHLYPVQYFKAFTPADEIVKSVRVDGVGWHKAPTEVACHCSHATLIHQLADGDADAYVILEDDGILTVHNQEVMPFLETFDPERFDFVQLFAVNTHFNKSPELAFTGSQSLEWKHVAVPPWGLYGYILSKKAANKVKGLITLSECSTPIDNAFLHLARRGVLRTGMLNYNIIIHDDDIPSTIR